MAVIHKQPLQLVTSQRFRPPGTVLMLLTVQLQDGVPCLWYEVEPDAAPPRETAIAVAMVGTGHSVPEGQWVYLGTVQLDDFVWHWYGRRELV